MSEWRGERAFMQKEEREMTLEGRDTSRRRRRRRRRRVQGRHKDRGGKGRKEINKMEEE